MDLRRYIQGVRKGRDINSIERKAMQDSFLADALEGYDKVKVEHAERIEKMIKQIIQQTRPKNNAAQRWGIVISIILSLGAGGYLLWEEFSFSFDDFLPLYQKITNTNTPIASEETFEMEQDSFLKNTNFAIFIPNHVEKYLSDSMSEPIISETEIKKMEEDKTKDIQEVTSGPKPSVGYREYENYLRKQLVRPTDEDCSEVKGKVILSFSIDGNGRPYNINITKSLCPSADAEAIRLLKEGPGWTGEGTETNVEVKF
ncbi:MAG: energy transducer TonB [Dysgonamonadaceae bacterium]|jgi:hypothetical protein|nr:energy transducer TonB [Dysgonamonadaceae bacterium]